MLQRRLLDGPDPEIQQTKSTAGHMRGEYLAGTVSLERVALLLESGYLVMPPAAQLRSLTQRTTPSWP